MIGNVNKKWSRRKVRLDHFLPRFLFRRFRVNYIINLNKSYITSCNLWREMDRVILNPSYKLESGSILITPRLFYRVGYLLYVFIINGILFFNQDRLYYQALYSLSYCLVLLINPSSKNLYKLNPRSNFANRFNKLTYKILNNKCK